MTGTRHAVEETHMTYLPPESGDDPRNRLPLRNRPLGAAAESAPSLQRPPRFLFKFKFLLLVGAKLLGVSWTFLLSLWIYVVIFGWQLAVVVMLLLLAHELGHYFAFRAYGLPARLPAFVPLLGAFTAGAAPQDLEQDAYIALAGPLTGLGLAAVCFARRRRDAGPLLVCVRRPLGISQPLQYDSDAAVRRRAYRRRALAAALDRRLRAVRRIRGARAPADALRRSSSGCSGFRR